MHTIENQGGIFICRKGDLVTMDLTEVAEHVIEHQFEVKQKDDNSKIQSKLEAKPLPSFYNR